MFLKNEGANEVIAKFDGKEVVFAAGKTINLAAVFPEHQVKQAAGHFMAKYGLKAVEKPEEKAADPQEAPAGSIAGSDKKAGKKKG